MSIYYLRVEAVNLANFVYDTHDISTIRGGSFLLLYAINGLKAKFEGRLNHVTHAASQGLFWFESDKESTSIIQKDVLQYLNDQTDGHATFVVAIQPDITGDFKQVLEKLEAQIHRQQWQLPTVAIPSSDAKAGTECYLDGWRPGTVKYRVDPSVESASISEATDFRRKEGAKLRHTLFSKILVDENHQGQISAKDLGELSLNPSKGILSGKIAYIYVDGNRFGSIRRQSCQTREDRQGFDRTIQDFREEFLRTLLEWAKNDPDFQTRNAENKFALRLEVLLWGGDEMILVVPAWVGWKVMDLFYHTCKGLAFKGLPLSHRAAMIFCHHNAPILLIRKLAEDLLTRAKTDLPKASEIPPADHSLLNEHKTSEQPASGASQSSGDSLHYLVLESFDMLQGKMDDFLRDYYKGINYADLLVSAAEMEGLFDAIRSIQSLAARSKVIKIIKAIQKADTSERDDLIDQVYKLVSPGDHQRLHAAIQTLTAKNDARWYMVTDLWDYLP